MSQIYATDLNHLLLVDSNHAKFYLEEALEEMHMVAEGVRATRMFLDRSERLGHQTPFLSTLGSLLDGEIEVEDAVRRMAGSYEPR